MGCTRQAFAGVMARKKNWKANGRVTYSPRRRNSWVSWTEFDADEVIAPPANADSCRRMNGMASIHTAEIDAVSTYRLGPSAIVFVEHFANLPGKRGRGEWLLNELDVRIQHAVMNYSLVCIP